MNWSAIDSGVIEVVQQKTKSRVWIPIHRDLRVVLDQAPRRSMKILSNQDGAPWTTDGFKSQWGHQMDCMSLLGGELYGLVFHGLRKSAVCFLLEAGCTVAETQSITGQSMQMVEHYAAMMNRRKLAASAMLKWEASRGAP